jgi:hypothetical protein
VRNLLLTGLAGRLKDYFEVLLAAPEGRGECVGSHGLRVSEFPAGAAGDDRSGRLRHRLAKAHLWHVSPRVANYMYQYRASGRPLGDRAYLAFSEWRARIDARPNRYCRLVREEERHEARADSAASGRLLEWMENCQADAALFTAPESQLQGALARCAKKLGLTNVAMIHSFDNLTTKGRHPILFDSYLVWNEIMRAELLRAYPEIDPDKVHVAGTPHFYFYHSPAHRLTRDEIADRYDLDAARPILLYAAGPNTLLPHEVGIARRLQRDLDGFAPDSRPQLVVRLHPWERDFGRWKALEDEAPAVRWSVPWETSVDDPTWAVPSHQDLREFCGLVRHSDVIINAASTMSLDAAICDTPAVCVNYALAPFERFAKHMSNFYHYDHYRPIAESGAVRIAKSPQELIAHIKTYLGDPSADAESRGRLVKRMCGPQPESPLSPVAEAIRESLPGETVIA